MPTVLDEHYDALRDLIDFHARDKNTDQLQAITDRLQELRFRSMNAKVKIQLADRPSKAR